MTTFVLSCAFAGFFGGTAAAPVVLGLAIFYGGIVQLLAGMWAFRRGESFAAAAFSSYGGRWADQLRHASVLGLRRRFGAPGRATRYGCVCTGGEADVATTGWRVGRLGDGGEGRWA